MISGRAEADPLAARVLALPGLADATESKIFSHFLERVISKMRLPRTSQSILEAFANIDVTAEKLSHSIRANAYFEHQFLRVIESMSKRENMPSLEGAVVMLGMQNSRNLVLALQILRTVHGTHAEWTKDGKLSVAPNDVVKFALKTEEVLAGNKSGYADTAYAAGLVFDILAQVAQSLVPEAKQVHAYIQTVYDHGLRSAQVSLQLARTFPDFAFKKYIFSACLIHDIGKVAMAVLDPSYLEFLEACASKNLPRPVRHFAEKARYGINHNALSALICDELKIFRSIERAVLHHHTPYLLRSGNKNLFQLASLICLSTNIANNFKKVDKMDDPVLAAWKGLELRDFKIEPRELISAVARVI